MTGHDEMRRAMVARARLTDDELATAAARFGIVADPSALPLRERSTILARMRETGDCFAAVVAARAGKTTHTERFYESSDGFEEMYRGGPVNVGRTVIGATLVRAPIYSAGIASLARVVR